MRQKLHVESAHGAARLPTTYLVDFVVQHSALQVAAQALQLNLLGILRQRALVLELQLFRHGLCQALQHLSCWRGWQE